MEQESLENDGIKGDDERVIAYACTDSFFKQKYWTMKVMGDREDMWLDGEFLIRSSKMII